jgi:hypothetical protein
MSRNILPTAAFALGAAAAVVCAQPQPKTFFKDKVKLADSDIQKIDQGQVVTRVLDSGDTKYGILVFGAVYVNAPVAKFGTVIRDIKRLTENRVYLAVQEFSPNGAPPKLSDFDRLTFDNKDIEELHTCKPGDCDIQVFNSEPSWKQVNWNAPDKYAQANRFLREKIYEGMNEYLSGGLKPFGSYRDRTKPLNVYEATKSMIDASYYLPRDKAGGIYREVIDYPQGKLAGAEDLFYWEKIDFGREPTVRVNHLMLFPQGVGVVRSVAANLQLYASRYIRVALQMYYCVPDTTNPNRPGFYLIEMNDSRMPDFSGLKLGIVRKVASGKATDATHDALTMYQRMLIGK